MASRRLLLVLALALITSAMALETFIPEKLLFMDRIDHPGGQSNFLFRSNAPFKRPESGCVFAYDEIVKRMHEVCVNSSVCGSLPDDFYMVDVSLLHGEPTGSELPDVKCEKGFFEDFPKLGEAVDWPIHGDSLPARDVTPKVRQKMAETLEVWQRDRLAHRVPQLRQWLDTPRQNNGTAVYLIHCEAGHDRTGEFSGSYMIEYGAMGRAWTYDEALEYDNTCFGHVSPIGHGEAQGVQWFCLYLKYKLGVIDDDCGLKD